VGKTVVSSTAYTSIIYPSAEVSSHEKFVFNWGMMNKEEPDVFDLGDRKLIWPYGANLTVHLTRKMLESTGLVDLKEGQVFEFKNLILQVININPMNTIYEVGYVGENW